MSLSKTEIVILAKAKAAQYGIEPSLFLALIEQESSFNTFASRFEPAFYEHYLRKTYPEQTTESVARSTSYGLCQIMGQTARELGFSNTSMCALCDEANGLEFGARKFARCLKASKNESRAALLSYNGGSNLNYPAQVLARQAKYAA